jgi:hypothetical protein
MALQKDKYWRGSEWPVEDIRRIKANEAHSRRVQDKRNEGSEDSTGGLYSLSALEDLPEQPVWDRRRDKAHRAHRRWLKEEERRRDAENTQRQINNGAAMLRLAPSQLTDPEVEARAWAAGYFQDNIHELTREGSKNYPIWEYRRHLEHSYDEYRRNPESIWRKICFTDPSYFENVSELIEFCAFMIERGEPLPQNLRKFGAAIFRENRESLARRAAAFRGKGHSLTLQEFTAGFAQRITQRFKGSSEKRPGKRGPAGGDYERRDQLIKIAARYIVERWKFEVTRSVSAKKGAKASAAAVVCEALKAVRIHMEEKSVNDICDIDKWVRYWPIFEGDSACRNLGSPKAKRAYGPKARASRTVRKVKTKPEG